LQGWGTYLTGATIGEGQTAGGGLDAQQWVDRFNAAFPNANASIQDQGQNENGQSAGSKVVYDTSGLPAGWQQALGGTGGVEFSDPSSKYNYKGGTDDNVINPAAVYNDPLWGQYTSNNNIKQPVDNFDKYLQTGIYATLAAMTGGAMAPLLAGGGAAAGGGLDAAGVSAGAGGIDAGVAGGAASDAAAGLGETGLVSASAGGTGSIIDSITAALNPANAINSLATNLTNPSWWTGQLVHQGMNYGVGQLEGQGNDPNYFSHLAESLGLGALGPTGSLISGGETLTNAARTNNPAAAIGLLSHYLKVPPSSGGGT
jgi:hypothetical protein